MNHSDRILRNAAALLLTCAVLSPTLSGCRAHGGSGPYTAAEPERRDTSEAQRLNREAADLMASEPERAEALLRQALEADLFFGPAHNNLGVLFLGRGELYAAASEFEWARKLMPGHPDPRLNLGLVLERSGRYADAMEAYHAALDARPGHLDSLQALTRAQIRLGEETGSTDDALHQIALEGTTAEWREWARQRLQ